MVNGIWPHDALGPMTNLAIRCAADGMWNLGRLCAGRALGLHRRLEYLGERRRVESGVRPFRSMTRAVGTEGRIVFASRVARIVALLARGIKLGAMLNEPRRRLVRGRLVTFGQSDGCAGLAWAADRRQIVAKVALDANRLFLVGCEMLPIVAAEAAG